MFKTSVLASGSKGNSIFIKSDNISIILDAGLSGCKILGGLSKLDQNTAQIRAIVISHEHSDHIKGAGILCRKLKIPLYSTKLTYQICKNSLGNIPAGVLFFENDKPFRIGNIEIHPFNSSHDVIDGCNFVFKRIDDNIRKLAVATDLGFSSNLMISRVQHSTTIILESNHDPDMLMQGPYPWHLKQRIKGRQGHLSNDQAVGVLSRVFHPGIRNLILAHLSEINNSPDLARKNMEMYLQTIRHELRLIVSSQYEPTELVDI